MCVCVCVHMCMCVHMCVYVFVLSEVLPLSTWPSTPMFTFITCVLKSVELRNDTRLHNGVLRVASSFYSVLLLFSLRHCFLTMGIFVWRLAVKRVRRRNKRTK